MGKKWFGAVLGLLLPLALVSAALAETVTEKVAKTGFLTVGTRFDQVPYSYVDDQGKLVGYSIDVINAIKTELQKQIGREVTIQMVEANDPAQRMQMLQNGDIDITCDMNFTWERDQYFDFSLSYALSGIRLLSKKGSNLGSPESLVGKRIAVVKGSVGESAIKFIQPKAQIVTSLASAEEGLAALQNGTIDAIAADSLSLAGIVIKNDPNSYQLTPEEPYARYGVACMIPENNSSFLNVVNYSIVKMMQAYVTQDPQTVAQINRWFGADGVVPLPPELIEGFFEFTIINRAQIPPDSPSNANR